MSSPEAAPNPAGPGPERGFSSSSANLALVCACVLLGLPMLRGGLWEPPELQIAELARRVAVSQFGASALHQASDPLLGPSWLEFGRGEFPLTSVAVAFRLFGAHDWAGRAVSMLFGLMGLVSLFTLLRQLGGRLGQRAAFFGCLALATTPLYAAQSRQMLGESSSLAGILMTTTGLALFALVPRESAPKVWAGLAWLCWALLGAVMTTLSRGIWLGLAAPALSLGALGLLGVAEREPRAFGPSARVAWRALSPSLVVLGLGLLGFGLGLRAWLEPAAWPKGWTPLLGSAMASGEKLHTFETLLGRLLHGAFPWSVIALATVGPAITTRERRLRLLSLALLLEFGLLVTAQGFLYGRSLPFAPLASVLLPGLAALGLVAAPRRGWRSALPAMTCIAVFVCLLWDVEQFADKLMDWTGVADSTVPTSFVTSGQHSMRLATAFLLAAMALFGLERGRRLPVEGLPGHLRVIAALRTAFAGNLAFGFVLVETALGTLAVLIQLSDHGLARLPQIASMGVVERRWLGTAFAWLPAVLVGLPVVVLVLRDLGRALVEPAAFVNLLQSHRSPGLRRIGRALARLPLLMHLRPERPFLVGCCTVLAGAYIVTAALPRLAEQLSPKQVLLRARQLAEPSEPIGLLGISAAAARYAGVVQSTHLGSSEQAARWLLAPGARRWLALSSKELPTVNAVFRRQHAGKNLPVVEASSGDILLASSLLSAGQANVNPMGNYLLEEAPTPRHRLAASFYGQIDAVGWELVTPEGRNVDAIDPGSRYELRIYLHAVTSVSLDWELFVHFDGAGRRHNEDHAALAGKLPTTAWRGGDWLVDRHEFKLEPSFAPGVYQLYFGFYRGSRRLEVTQGGASENRVLAGNLRVR